MAERCSSCGAELFAGQQFCRACGTPTRRISGEDLPTQILPDQQPTAPPPPLSTSPLNAGRNTSDPVYGAGFSGYQPHPARQQHTSPVLPPPPRRRSRRGWLYAVVALLVFFVGASVVAGLFFANRATRRVVRVARPHVTVPAVPEMPPPHPPIGAGEEDMFVGNEGAEVSGRQTVVTKTYPLARDGVFELHNISGDITVEGWDEAQAEVKIIKRGGSEEQRAGLRIVREQSAGRLALTTTPEAHRGVEEVEYQVKLPRSLRGLEIVSNNSNVELTDMQATSVSINVQRGNIELEDVSGTVNTRTTKGNTHVVLTEAAGRGAPQIFNGIHGSIELELAPGTDAELKAETIDGDIEIDEDLGIKVEKRMVGQQAVGRIGKGGEPIVVKTVSGGIKIKN